MSDEPMGESTEEQAAAEPAAAPAEAAGELSEEAQGFLSELGKTLKSGSESDLAQTVGRLARRWVEDEMEGAEALVDRSVLDDLDAAIEDLDQLLTKQVNEIIHHDDFRELEGSWRGLEHLVNRTMTSPQLKINVLNVAKDEVATVFKTWKGKNRFKSPLYYRIYEEAGGMPNGDPYAAVIGDYHFGASTKDIDILKGMSEICSVAHAPFIAGAAPSLLELDSWQGLQDSMDIEKLLSMPQYAEWNKLRESQDSRYIGLAMPRFLARTPYSVDNNPIEGFAFDEDAEGHDENKYVWSNASFAMGANLTRAFAEYGWCAGIRGYRSGGKVDSLPFHSFPNIEGGVEIKCPTEVAISRSKESRLSDNGLMPLSHWTNTTDAVFVSANSLKAPEKFQEAEATASERLNCMLPYMFCASRFGHYLTRMCYEWVGMGMEQEEVQRELHNWMVQYTLGNPAQATEAEKQRRPLQDFKVDVTPVEGQPGVYDAQFELRPHFQLEKLGAKLTLVSRVRKG